MKTFKDRVAVVTGAASGIGRGLADRFAKEGMRVVLADVEQPALEHAERVMTDAGANVFAMRTDVSDQAQVEALAQAAYDRFGAVHILCNNAGVGGGGLSWEQSLEDWQWVLGVDLWGPIHGVRTFVPRMLAGGDEGHIVNTASMAGLLAGPYIGSYNVSKFGVVALSETLHHELAMASGGKIKVSVLCPGFVDTNIDEGDRNRPSGRYERAPEGTPEAAQREMFKQILHSGQKPAEVAQKVFDAIVNERFYILTHPEFASAVTARAENIVNDRNPSSPGFV
jgi:NAD(P)-dependent dehydrogenase (short-subunit alcohol dehydrogenase family)